MSTPPSIGELRHAFQSRRCRSGEVIYRPEDPADRLFLVRSHRVRLLRPLGIASSPDHATVHAILPPGALFGDALRTGAATMDEFAVAAGPVDLWWMGSRELRSLSEFQPAMLLEILRAQGEHVRRLRRRVFALGARDVTARVAEVLLELADTLGEPGPHTHEVAVRGVTQKDLADLVGASRSFVSTLVNDLKRRGLVGSVGRTLLVRDPAGLRQTALAAEVLEPADHEDDSDGAEEQDSSASED